MTLQLLAGGVDPVTAASAQLAAGVKAPLPGLEKETVPVGLEAAPAVLASVTVAVQALPCPANTGEAQLTTVDVLRAFAVRLTLPELVPWLLSPP